MEFNKLIEERYSVRKFKSEHISQTVIEKILAAGHKAPTGCNYQPQRILVLNTDESLDKLKKCTKCHFNAPTAMIICHNTDESWKRPYDSALSSAVDASIVTTYMMLAAQQEGIGSCWVMHFKPDEIKKEFNVPGNVEPAAILVMGYPADDAEPLDLHFKNRPIDEVVVYEKF
jgi:nitroreductase